MDDPENWKPTKRLKYNLLKAAIAEGRGAAAILRIQWRLARERHLNAGFANILRKFEELNKDQPRAIRALNLHEERKGTGVTNKETTEQDKDKPVLVKMFARVAPQHWIIVPDRNASEIEIKPQPGYPVYKKNPAIDYKID